MTGGDRVLDQTLCTDSPKGRNIGLSNGQLKTMSGEEVDGMEQGVLASHVGQVGPPGTRLNGDGGWGSSWDLAQWGWGLGVLPGLGRKREAP